MVKLRILGAIALAMLMLAPDTMAQRRGGGGGAARSGMRGAAIGGMAGGSEGAQKGAKAGVAVGVTRNVAERSADRRAVDSESQTRTEYESTDEYATTEHSNFDEAPPEVLATPATEESAPAEREATTKKGAEAVVAKDGKPVLGMTFPADWKQKAGANSVSATSPKGNAWAAIATLDRAKDAQAGVKTLKEQLGKSLDEIKYDAVTKTERGALLLTGEGKSKKTGIPVVFAIGVFNASPEQLAGAAFVADKNVEEHYKQAVRYMCQTIRGEKELSQQEREAAKPVIN
jgi:hypothetical protein